MHYKYKCWLCILWGGKFGTISRDKKIRCSEERQNGFRRPFGEYELSSARWPLRTEENRRFIRVLSRVCRSAIAAKSLHEAQNRQQFQMYGNECCRTSEFALVSCSMSEQNFKLQYTFKGEENSEGVQRAFHMATPTRNDPLCVFPPI